MWAVWYNYLRPDCGKHLSADFTPRVLFFFFFEFVYELRDDTRTLPSWSSASSLDSRAWTMDFRGGRDAFQICSFDLVTESYSIFFRTALTTLCCRCSGRGQQGRRGESSFLHKRPVQSSQTLTLKLSTSSLENRTEVSQNATWTIDFPNAVTACFKARSADHKRAINFHALNNNKFSFAKPIVLVWPVGTWITHKIPHEIDWYDCFSMPRQKQKSVW